MFITVKFLPIHFFPVVKTPRGLLSRVFLISALYYILHTYAALPATINGADVRAALLLSVSYRDSPASARALRFEFSRRWDRDIVGPRTRPLVLKKFPHSCPFAIQLTVLTNKLTTINIYFYREINFHFFASLIFHDLSWVL